MASLYQQVDTNIRKSWILMLLFVAGMAALGYSLSVVWGSVTALYGVLIFSAIFTFFSYWYSDKIVLKLNGAQPIEFKDNPQLYRLVENLCITAGLPTPKIYLIPDSAPNAFATGRDPQHAVVALTSGLLKTLDKSELEGVIAHELSHIGNRDILLMTLVAVLVGAVVMLAEMVWRFSFFNRDRDNRSNPFYELAWIFIVILFPIFAQIVKFAISRKREFLADASGALLTRYPEGLARALEKIAAYPQEARFASQATAHLFIASPFKADTKRHKVSWITRLFLTHPPIEERIAALRGMKV